MSRRRWEYCFVLSQHVKNEAGEETELLFLKRPDGRFEDVTSGGRLLEVLNDLGTHGWEVAANMSWKPEEIYILLKRQLG